MRKLIILFLGIIICFSGFFQTAEVRGQAADTSNEWTQDAHDAQRTGYTAEEPLEPWTLLWTWNGPDEEGGTGNHFVNVPREARTVTGGSNIYAPAGSLGLFALDKATGSETWNVTVAAFNAPPAYDPSSGSLFAGGADGNLYKIDASSGDVVDSYDAGDPLNKSVLLVDEFAYVVTDNGELHKVDTDSMTAEWVYAGNAPIATPPAYSVSRDVIVYATNDLYVHAVQVEDGSAKWHVKPSPNPAEFPNEMDGMWPVIAEQHGIVFVRMRLDHNPGLWGGPGPGGMYPNSNSETRAFLQAYPQLKNLFALDLDDGTEAFIPAVGYGGPEGMANGEPFLDVGPLPVIRVLPDGQEVAYMVFRSGQGNPPDGRWDSHMGEMVLDDKTVPGLAAGDLRFVSFPNSYTHITDEQTPVTMAGDTLFRAHWAASESTRITDRSNELGLTFENPIRSTAHPVIVRRQTGCDSFNSATHWTTCNLILYNDGRYWDGPGWWIYWNVPNPQPAANGEAYSDGRLPDYTYVSDGLVVVEGNGGELAVFRHSGTSTASALPVSTKENTLTPQVASLTANAAEVGRYTKFEATFEISRTYSPESMLPYYYYDPNDPVGADGITIDGHFIAPSGTELVVPAFYHQEYTGAGTHLNQTSTFNWKLRFAPEELGDYEYYITITDRNGSTRYPETETLQFQSIESDSRGFIRVSSRDPRFLEFSDGTSFVPISSGHQWWAHSHGRSLDYEETFTEYGRSGINLTRIWDQNDGYALTVEGHFDAYHFPDDFNPEDRDVNIDDLPKGTQMNQRGNYEEDIIIEAAERNGVYIILSAHSDPYWIWDASVHDESWNPSPAVSDDPAHIRYWQRNFRYRVARWGYSSAIMAWETWNEHGHVAADSDLYDFYQQYSQYQQQTDPYHHLRTTSQGSQSWSPAFWSSSAFDIASYHDYMMISRYSADLTYDAANFVYRFAQCLRTPTARDCDLGLGDGSAWQGGPKPIFWGELDTGTEQWNEANPQPKATHDIRWTGLFSPIGMAPIDWYWESQSDSFIATKHQEAAIASRFFEGVDYAGLNFAYLSTDDVRLTSEPVTTSDPRLRVLAMRSADGTQAYAWVQNLDNARWDQPVNDQPLTATFSIAGMPPGSYRIETWDTYGDQVSDGEIVTAEDGTATIQINDLKADVAVKILFIS
ncbi:MAG: PQQ-binding-like beta-propeller repeat protein [Anaerolineae bacterium]|nr:PQQ-binding-like beta-propeller repeat protein [Anaerolineae bacterium]